MQKKMQNTGTIGIMNAPLKIKETPILKLKVSPIFKKTFYYFFFKYEIGDYRFNMLFSNHLLNA